MNNLCVTLWSSGFPLPTGRDKLCKFFLLHRVTLRTTRGTEKNNLYLVSTIIGKPFSFVIIMSFELGELEIAFIISY